MNSSLFCNSPHSTHCAYHEIKSDTPWKLNTSPPENLPGTQKERLVFQLSFFRSEPLNFGGVQLFRPTSFVSITEVNMFGWGLMSNVQNAYGIPFYYSPYITGWFFIPPYTANIRGPQLVTAQMNGIHHSGMYGWYVNPLGVIINGSLLTKYTPAKTKTARQTWWLENKPSL